MTSQLHVRKASQEANYDARWTSTLELGRDRTQHRLAVGNLRTERLTMYKDFVRNCEHTQRANRLSPDGTRSPDGCPASGLCAGSWLRPISVFTFI